MSHQFRTHTGTHNYYLTIVLFEHCERIEDSAQRSPCFGSPRWFTGFSSSTSVEFLCPIPCVWFFLFYFQLKIRKLFLFCRKILSSSSTCPTECCIFVKKEDGYSRHTDSKMPMTSFWNASFSLFFSSRASLQLWMLYDYNDNNKLYYRGFTSSISCVLEECSC